MSQLLYRKATPADRAAMYALWQRVFGDPLPFITHAVERFVGFGNLWVAEADGRLLAVLSAVPCTMGGHAGVYLYALATSPAAQGRGVMTGLMQAAEREAARTGAAFAALVPASAPLFGYYQKRGYTQAAPLCWVEMQLDTGVKPLHTEQAGARVEGGPAPASRGSVAGAAGGSMCGGAVSGAAFAALRRRHAQCACLGFAPYRYDEVLADLFLEGAQLCQTRQGYALYTTKEDTLLVPELFADTPAAAEALLVAMAAGTGCRRAVLTLAEGPAATATLAAGGRAKPFGLIKTLDPARPVVYPYIRFGFEDWTRLSPLL